MPVLPYFETHLVLAYEGLSGSGKSETISSLMVQLTKAGHKVALCEWNSIEFFRKITGKLNSMKILSSTVFSFVQWCDFLWNYFFKIMPLLQKNYIVIADRYIFTGLTRDMANQANQFIGNLLSKLVRKPDLLFFYDIKPEICYERIRTRGKRLFHTNQKILKSRILKNKELYYLKKIEKNYVRLFMKGKYLKDTNLIFLRNSTDSYDFVLRYLSSKEQLINWIKTTKKKNLSF